MIERTQLDPMALCEKHTAVLVAKLSKRVADGEVVNPKSELIIDVVALQRRFAGSPILIQKTNRIDPITGRPENIQPSLEEQAEAHAKLVRDVKMMLAIHNQQDKSIDRLILQQMAVEIKNSVMDFVPSIFRHGLWDELDMLYPAVFKAAAILLALFIHGRIFSFSRSTINSVEDRMAELVVSIRWICGSSESLPCSPSPA